jgi:hypothetical protein
VSDALVPLCRCVDIFQAQLIRASLEARGIPALVDGEHHGRHMMFAPGVIELRIMIPRSQLRLGYALARDVIEDLPEPEFDDEPVELAHELEPPPHRRATPEDLVPYPDDDDVNGDDNDGRLEPFDDDDEEDDLAQMRDRRSLVGPRIGVGIGLVLSAVMLANHQIARGLIVLAILALLVYVRVLPVTAASPAAPPPG